MAFNNQNWGINLTFDSISSIWDYDDSYQTHEGFAFDFFTAASFGEYDYVKNMLNSENIPDINMKNHGRWTALMYAIYYGHQRLLELLLQYKACIHTSNDKGRNGLMLASRCGHETIVNRLIEAGSFLEARDHDDWTALHHAIYASDFAVVRTLLQHGANPNACDRKTWKNPLMYACILGDFNIVELLLRNGASTEFVNTRGQTAGHLARNAGHLHIADLIDNWSQKEKIGLSLLEGPKAVECSPFLLNRRIQDKKVPHDAIGAGVISDLDTLLIRIGLPSLRELFRQQEVDFTTFLSLTDQDLKECGVTKLGPRLKILAGIDRWHNNAPLSTGLESSYGNRISSELRHLKNEFEETSRSFKELKKNNEKEQNSRVMAEMKVMEMRNKMQELHSRMRNLTAHLCYAMHLTFTLTSTSSLTSYQLQPIQDATAACSTQMEELLRMIDSCVQK